MSDNRGSDFQGIDPLVLLLLFFIGLFLCGVMGSIGAAGGGGSQTTSQQYLQQSRQHLNDAGQHFSQAGQMMLGR